MTLLTAPWVVFSHQISINVFLYLVIEIKEILLGMPFLYMKTICYTINCQVATVIECILNNISKYGLSSGRAEHYEVPPSIAVGPKTCLYKFAYYNHVYKMAYIYIFYIKFFILDDVHLFPKFSNRGPLNRQALFSHLNLSYLIIYQIKFLQNFRKSKFFIIL